MRRAGKNNHALDRLRERYFPDAEMADALVIRRLAREVARTVRGLPMQNTKTVFVTHRGELVKVVYDPINDAVRTILPREGLMAANALGQVLSLRLAPTPDVKE